MRTFNLERLFEFLATSVPVGTTMRYVVRLINYTIAFQFKSVECERLGRTMNLTKSKDRISLGDKTFFNLCFAKNAMPSLEAIDYPRLIAAWYADGHDTAVSRRRGDQEGQVLARLAVEAARRNHTPVGTVRRF